MKHGVAVFPTAGGLPLPELGRLAEDLGFESIFFPEHSHMPVHYAFPSWDPTGDRIGPEYARVLEPFVSLASVATATTTLKVGTGVCLLAQRDPIQTAKTVATLDLISGGRFLFGVAPGWNLTEMANHGYDPSTRFVRLREHLQAMEAIWSSEVSSYDGVHAQFDRIESWPKPTQMPPVLLGGAGPTIVERVLAMADEWLAEPEAGLEHRIDDLLGKAAERGHRVSVTVFGAEPGSAEHWRSTGAHRCVYWLTPDNAELQRRELQSLAPSDSR